MCVTVSFAQPQVWLTTFKGPGGETFIRIYLYSNPIPAWSSCKKNQQSNKVSSSVGSKYTSKGLTLAFHLVKSRDDLAQHIQNQLLLVAQQKLRSNGFCQLSLKMLSSIFCCLGQNSKYLKSSKGVRVILVPEIETPRAPLPGIIKTSVIICCSFTNCGI